MKINGMILFIFKHPKYKLAIGVRSPDCKGIDGKKDEKENRHLLQNLPAFSFFLPDRISLVIELCRFQKFCIKLR